MAPSPPRLRILSVGGNAISAFLSWRLQTTNACDVTLVWKSGYDAVAQYGVSFKSKEFGNERFKPRHVVRTPEEAASREPAYDYVILCVKALPDVYDLAGVIESVVTPQHTCILVNTTNTLGVESHLEHRFPTNVILSLVSGVNISQTGVSEFEHTSSTELSVGTAGKSATIPVSIQNDMASALAITLSSAQMECKVSENIRQEQYDRMIGPIAFYPASVLFETPQHSKLLEKVGVRQLVSDVIDELVTLATSQGCSFPDQFKQKTIDKMTMEYDSQSIMYQDFVARRPMEVETFLGSPIKVATETGIKLPRIETLYAMLHHLNTSNQNRPATEPSSPVVAHPPPRLSSAPPRASMNGARGRGYPGPGMPPPRRGPPSMAGPPRAPNGHPHPPGTPRHPRDPNGEDGGLEEFSHLMLYEDTAEEGHASQNGNLPPTANGGPSSGDMALKERELMLRQRELRLREQEMNMRRGGGGPGGGRRMSSGRDAFGAEEDDYFDSAHAPPMPQIDPDNFDMMSVTTRRNRKKPTAGQIRKNPETAGGGGSSRPPSAFSRHFGGGRNRASARAVDEIPGMHDSLLDNPMMAYSSNRYGNVDRKEMHAESRANSLTAGRLQDYGHHASLQPPSRRTSQSPGHNYHPATGRGRPNTSHDPYMGPPNGMAHAGRPSPPGGMRAPVPRHPPPGHGNTLTPHQIEHQPGMNGPYPPPGPPS